MCHETVDHSIAALKLIPSWFVISKTLNKFILLFTQIVYSFFAKDSNGARFFVMKLAFLV